MFVDSSPHSRPFALQLLQPWCPAFGVKYSHNQFFVMFEDHAPPSRLRSWIKRDILSRRCHLYFESCSNIVATRAGEDSANEHDWFRAASEAMEKDMPHCVRTVFHNGAAYDLQMQRVVSVAPCRHFDDLNTMSLFGSCGPLDLVTSTGLRRRLTTAPLMPYRNARTTSSTIRALFYFVARTIKLCCFRHSRTGPFRSCFLI
jgi:hypothetical protein